MKKRLACAGVVLLCVLAIRASAEPAVTVYDVDSLEALERQLLDTTVSNRPDFDVSMTPQPLAATPVTSWQPQDSNVYVTLRD